MDGLKLNKDGLEFQINDFEFVFDSAGNLIARHTDTGNELVFNSDGNVDVSSVRTSNLAETEQDVPNLKQVQATARRNR
jgi:hypothetical protein